MNHQSKFPHRSRRDFVKISSMLAGGILAAPLISRANFFSGSDNIIKIALIGCGNLYRDENLRVPLSSVDQSSSLIGQEAARIALHMLKSKVPPAPETVILKPQLIVRGSTERS